jgi:polysaccharide pyruvyl transferase WcaK-like protein
MNIEIVGINPQNKGARMMFDTIVKNCKFRFGNDTKIVVKVDSNLSWKFASKENIYKKLHYRKYHFDFGDFGFFIPSNIRKKNNIILDKELDLVFDASGFAYGDQWTYRIAKYAAKNSKRMHKRKIPYILMPQAFGPFDNKTNEYYTKKLFKYSSIIFVRDKESYQHVINLNLEKDVISKIKLSPDITINNKPKRIIKPSVKSKRVCIILNEKIISSSEVDNISKIYMKFISEIINNFHHLGKEVFLLNHEGNKDLSLCLEVKKVHRNIEIIDENDPWLIKSIIGQSSFVFSSRFHGLVNSLSQSIPSITIGWSHKYHELMSDFGQEKYLIQIDDKLTDIAKLIKELVDNEMDVKSTLKEAVNLNSIKIEEMWEEIFDTIKQ